MLKPQPHPSPNALTGAPGPTSPPNPLAGIRPGGALSSARVLGGSRLPGAPRLPGPRLGLLLPLPVPVAPAVHLAAGAARPDTCATRSFLSGYSPARASERLGAPSS